MISHIQKSILTLSIIALSACYCQQPGTAENAATLKTESPAADTTHIQVTLRQPIEYPSASAGLFLDSNWWIIGDDAANLLLIDAKSTYSYYPLPFQREFKKSDAAGLESSHKTKPFAPKTIQENTPFPLAARIKKKSKLDFEALASYTMRGMHHVWAFGSGSKSPQRDTGLYWNFEPHTFKANPFKINLKPLYEYLQNRSQISPEKWNIEGACIAENGETYLCLFNRIPATLIKIKLKAWFRYLEIGSIPLDSDIEISTFKLPKIDGHSAGFSGASFDTERKSIWFSASVEITKDPVRDGEILGSFIGEISLLSGEIERTPVPLPEDRNGSLKTKLESLSLVPQSNPGFRIFYGLVDSDQGGSQLLHLKFPIPAH